MAPAKPVGLSERAHEHLSSSASGISAASRRRVARNISRSSAWISTRQTSQRLNAGQAPLLEPGLNELIAAGLAAKKLSFTTDPKAACANADVLWLCYDTPVNENDESDVEFVLAQSAPRPAAFADGRAGFDFRATARRHLRDSWKRNFRNFILPARRKISGWARRLTRLKRPSASSSASATTRKKRCSKNCSRRSRRRLFSCAPSRRRWSSTR